MNLKHVFSILILSVMFAGCSRKETTSYHRTEHGVHITDSKTELSVEFFNEKIVGVLYNDINALEHKSNSVVNEKEIIDWSLQEVNGKLILESSDLSVEVDLKTKAISYNTKSGKVLLKENERLPREIKLVKEAPVPTYSLKQNFTLTEDEHIYGFGQFEFSKINYRNTDEYLHQWNAGNVLPIFVSTNGYAVLWDNASKTNWHDGSDGTYLKAEAGDAISYYLIAGEEMDDLVAGYRKLTGGVPMLPKAAFGYWQSRERYGSQKEILNEVEQYRKRNIPLDYIVLDWLHWGMDNMNWSSLKFDKDYFPDPKAMSEAVHKNYAQIMCVYWPNVGMGTDIYKDLEAIGALSNDTNHWSSTRVIDPWNQKAADIHWDYIYNGFIKNGIDAFWLDSSEPDVDLTNDIFDIGYMAKYVNAYPLKHSENFYTRYRENVPEKRCVILTRAAWAGQQRNSTVVWSGDIPAKWSELHNQVIGGINFCMSGMPYWTSDIGGFWNGRRGADFLLGHHDNAFKEFYVRWFQHGAFTPMFRSHGAHSPREIYKYGNPGDWAYDVQVQYNKLRYRLLPYIYSTAWKVTNENYTMLRGLAMDYKSDPTVLNIENEYMFGQNMLVRPVTEPLYYPEELPDQNIPSKNFYTADGEAGGLTAEYYTGQNFDEFVFTQKDTAIQNYWMRYPPIKNRREDYSVRWTGFIQPDESGEFKLSAMVDDGMRLWIDDKLVIDAWKKKKDVERDYVSCVVKLDANKKHKFKLEYYQNEFAADIRCFWCKADKGQKHITEVQKVQVYLPKGDDWYDFWTGEKLAGGETIQREAPIEIMPLYVKAGAILPMGPVVQYANEKPQAPIELRVYAGNDGEFTIYEDEGENYNYENGEFSTIPISWNEKNRELTIANRIGEFNGMVENRTFKVVLVDKDHGVGLEEENSIDKTITYNGEKVVINF